MLQDTNLTAKHTWYLMGLIITISIEILNQYTKIFGALGPQFLLKGGLYYIHNFYGTYLGLLVTT